MTSPLQLVGVTSLMIASKYEEIYPPEVPSFFLLLTPFGACQHT